MGNTCAKTTRKKEKLPHFKSEILTHQEQVARNLQNDVIFKVVLENIKVKHIPVNSASLQVKFGKYKCLDLPEIKNIKSPHWKIKEEFEIKMNTKDLSNTYFTMSLKHQNQEIGNIKLSFMKIVTGPVNHDMLLNIKDDDDGRVTFMLTVAQQVAMKLIPKEIQFELNDEGLKYERHKKPKPQAYNFNIKIKSHNQEYESHHSYNYVNKYEQQAIENQGYELHQEQNDFFRNQDNLKNQNLSEDEFNVNDIDEKNNLQVPNLKGAGTINKVQDTLQNIENRKKEKGKIYRLKSQRQSHLQGLRDGTVNTSGLTQKQKQQIQQSKEKEQIKRKSTLISLSQNFQNQSNQNSENPQQLSNTIIETYDEVLDWFKIQTWNFKDLMDDDIPQVELKIFADEFASSTFYMKLWSCSENLQYLDPFSGGYNKKIGDKSIMQKRVSVLQIQKHNSMQLQRQNHNHKSNIYDDNFEEESFQTNDAYIDHEMVGHAEISMSKFISDNYSEVLTNFDKNIMLKIQTLKDLKVWHHGKNIGVCHGTFTSCHVPFFRQMYAGVRTENGISKSMQIYLKKKNIDKQNKLPLQFRQIISNQDFIEEQMEYLGSTQLTFRQRMRTNQDIKNNLIKIYDLLKVNQSENGNLFKNYEQLLDAQAILVNLAKHVISYATQVDEILRDYYYNILMEIINRDELDLSNMGFESELYQAKNEENGQKKGLNIKKLKKYGKYTNETIERKISIGLTYQKFLYDVLGKVLEKLEQQGLNEKEQQFVHNFSSLAYFRIPQFREQLLEAVSFKIKNNQDFIHEWSGANNLDDVKQTFFQSLFSWERDFYDYLKTQPRYQYHLEELEQTLQNKKWQAKFQKTGVGFYLFMGSWAKYILKVQQLKHLDLPWGVIEGYETLIKAFLYELKIRDAEHYPDSLKETSQILLLNNLHLRPFLYVIYNKTNVYNSRQVFYCYDMLNLWFQTLITNGLKIPTNFDYNFLFKGLQITFDSKRNEHAISTAKALLLLYNNYQLFPLDKKYIEISKLAFSRKTFYFFAHWSKTVRVVFMHFLVYRIYHYHRKLSLVDNKVQEYKHQKEILQLELKELDKKNLSKEEKEQSMNNYMIAQYLKVIKFAKYSKKKIESYLKRKDIPIQQQLHNNSLRVKLIDLKSKLKIQKNAQKQQEVAQGKSKGSLEIDRYISTPSKNSVYIDKNAKQNSKPTKNYKKFSENIMPDFDVTQNSQSYKTITGEKLSDSMQSMAIPIKKMLRDISDISGQKNPQDYFSENFSSDSISDFEDYQNQKILEQGLERKYGEMSEKKDKSLKFSDHIQLTSPGHINNNHSIINQNNTQILNQNFSEKRNRKISQNLNLNSAQNRKKSTENDNQLKKQIIKTHQARVLNIQNVKGKKVYQGRMEHDKNNKILFINQKSYKTLLQAYEEFEYIMKDYEIWYRQNLDKINQQKHLSSEEKLNKLREALVPDLPIKIHKDESESKNFQDDQEW